MIKNMEVRGKGVNSNEWHYGYVAISGKEISLVSNRTFQPEYVFTTIIQTPILQHGKVVGYSWNDVIPETVGRYIKTLADLIIYDGDIFFDEDREEYFYVEYDEDDAIVYAVYQTDVHPFGEYTENDAIIPYGNIHDNRDLMGWWKENEK